MATPRKRLRARRKALGYSRERLAELLDVTWGTVGRWERGESTPEPLTQRRLAELLEVKVHVLIDLLNPRDLPAGAGGRVVAAVGQSEIPRQPELGSSVLVRAGSELDRVHAVVPSLRQVLDAFDLPEDGPARSLAQIGADVVQANEHRLEARYGILAETLPSLLAELARASHLAKGSLQRQGVAALRTLAFRAADGIAFKFGYLDLSARLVDFMRLSAAVTDDPLLVAAAEYVRTETFFANGDLRTAGRALVKAADDVALSNCDIPEVAAAYGSLHMRAAVVAGRIGDSTGALGHLHEARQAAERTREGVYHGTAFGPHSIRIHELAVAAELGDPPGIERASTWHPPSELPAERRSHYYIDLGRAQLNLGHPDDAYASIEMAREAAPQHTREHPQVKSTVGTILQLRPGNSRVVELAAWTGARAV